MGRLATLALLAIAVVGSSGCGGAHDVGVLRQDTDAPGPGLTARSLTELRPAEDPGSGTGVGGGAGGGAGVGVETGIALDRPLPVGPPLQTLPLRFARRLPVVRATINGEGPFSFVVDTGAGTGVVVSRRLAGRLGLRSVGRVRVFSQGRVTEAHRVIVNDVRLGDLKLGPVGGLVQDLTPFRPLVGEDYEGILGFTLFDRLRLTFDYPGRQLELGTPGDLFADGRRVLEYQRIDDTPVLGVTVGRWRTALTVDTGSSFGVVLPERFHARMRWLQPPQSGPSSLGVTGRVDHMMARLDGSLRIGQHEVVQPRVIFGKGFIGLLGSEILQRFRVSFDPVRRTIAFERSRGPQRTGAIERAGAVEHASAFARRRASERRTGAPTPTFTPIFTLGHVRAGGS